MKKLVSLAVFVILLAWSWNLIHSDPVVSFETHSIIQQRLSEIIELSVQKHKSSAKNFRLLRLWTETLNDEKVKAHFVYNFSEGETSDASSQTISGEAWLRKAGGSQGGQENWKVEKVQTSSNQLVFQEPSLVEPEGSKPKTEGSESPKSKK